MAGVTIIIPVKDEEDGLKYLLGDFQSSPLAENYDISFIFVIDVRTSDSSREIASKFSDRIIDQDNTTGKGSAVNQAVKLWKEDPTSMVIFLDADGSYSFESVSRILGTLEKGADVASGSRFLSNSNRPAGMSRLHNFGNKALSMFSSLRNKRKISDLCTGLWGFRMEALLHFDIKSRGFDLEAELAGLVRRHKLNHVEVNVDWSQRKGGSSKLRSLTDGSIILLRIFMT